MKRDSQSEMADRKSLNLVVARCDSHRVVLNVRLRFHLLYARPELDVQRRLGVDTATKAAASSSMAHVDFQGGDRFPTVTSSLALANASNVAQVPLALPRPQEIPSEDDVACPAAQQLPCHKLYF